MNIYDIILNGNFDIQQPFRGVLYMMNTIAADVIINRFQIGSTDFRDLGQCAVVGEIKQPGTLVIKNALHLGELIFEEEISFNGFDFAGNEIFFGNAIFKQEFVFGAMCKFQSVPIYLESATFEKGLDFDCNEMDCSLHLGSVNILGNLDCVGAMDEGTWIYAGDRPAVAWVLQQAIQSNIQYQIADAPPWMQRPMTDLD